MDGGVLEGAACGWGVEWVSGVVASGDGRHLSVVGMQLLPPMLCPYQSLCGDGSDGSGGFGEQGEEGVAWWW